MVGLSSRDQVISEHLPDEAREWMCHLSHIDGFSDVDPNAISSKYSMYMLANTGDNSEPIARSSCRCISDPISK